METKILVSSCLLGKNCAYDGASRASNEVVTICNRVGYVDICPEMVGGLSCPRERHEIAEGAGRDVLEGDARVISSEGEDHTHFFVRGAEQTLKVARGNGIKVAILKSKSPSCGKGTVHDGTFKGSYIEGNGVAAELLIEHGIKVFTEKETQYIPALFE